MRSSVLLILGTAALLLAVRGGGAMPLSRSAAGRRHQPPPPSPRSAPLSWRLCAGTDAGVLVRTVSPSCSPFPRGSNPQPRVALLLTQPLSGCRVSGERLASSGGRDSWLVHLHVPAGARPGLYTGQLVVPTGASVTRQPAVIEVLPFELMRPSKQYAVSQVPMTAWQCCAPEEAETTALRRLREIGIGSLSLAAAPSDRTALESRVQAAGLRGPVLIPVESPATPGHGSGGGDDTGSPASPPLPGAAPPPSAPRSSTAPPHVRWYALCSSPPSPERAAALHAGGSLIACLTEGTEAPAGVDLPIFPAGGQGAARLLPHSGTSMAGASGWWRWDAGAATPLENRLRCGALLWKSGLSGALVEFRPTATADPAWPLRWDAVCQGVQDSRYLTTLFSLIRQVKDKDRSSPLPGQAEGAMAAALNGLAERPSPAGVDGLRESAITWIMRLGKLVWS